MQLARGSRSGVAQPRFRGDRLRAAREAAGLSEKDLTLSLGLSGPIRIRQWENEVERPRPRFIPQLADALGIDPLHLLDVDPADPPLAALRLAAGKSTKDLAPLGMSAMTYLRIEDARVAAEVSGEMVAAIAEALALEPERIAAAIRRTRRDHRDYNP